MSCYSPVLSCYGPLTPRSQQLQFEDEANPAKPSLDEFRNNQLAAEKAAQKQRMGNTRIGRAHAKVRTMLMLLFVLLLVLVLVLFLVMLSVLLRLLVLTSPLQLVAQSGVNKKLNSKDFRGGTGSAKDVDADNAEGIYLRISHALSLIPYVIP